MNFILAGSHNYGLEFLKLHYNPSDSSGKNKGSTCKLKKNILIKTPVFSPLKSIIHIAAPVCGGKKNNCLIGAGCL